MWKNALIKYRLNMTDEYQITSDSSERIAVKMYEPSKGDWRLFREHLPGWQERYMVRLCDEYAAILTGEKRGSDAFWEIEKRIREDKKSLGVQVNLSGSDMGLIILTLLRDNVIWMEDLDGFSGDLMERIKFLVNAD